MIDRIKKWKQIGYEVILYFLKLPNEKMAIKRVQLRVDQGGHNVPKDVIIRRYPRGGKNMKKESYSSMALNAMHRASKEAIEKNFVL